MKTLEDILNGKTLKTPISTGKIEQVDYQLYIVYVKVNGNWHSLAQCEFVPPPVTPANEAGLAIAEIRTKLYDLADELAGVEEGLM